MLKATDHNMGATTHSSQDDHMPDGVKREGKMIPEHLMSLYEESACNVEEQQGNLLCRLLAENADGFCKRRQRIRGQRLVWYNIRFKREIRCLSDDLNAIRKRC